MIIIENVTINGCEFTRTTSDERRYVVRDGMSYVEAIDPVDSGRVYAEGDIIQEEEPEI